MRLEGCLPQGGLLKSLGRIGGRRATAGNAWLALLDDDGATMGSYFVSEVTVVDAEPSARGTGLLDLTVTLWCGDALPGAERAWDLIRTGRLNRTGMWHGLTPEDRRAWLSVTLWSREYRHREAPTPPRAACSPWTAGTSWTRTASTARSARPSTAPAATSAGTSTPWTTASAAAGARPPFTLHWDSSTESRTRLSEPSPDYDRETPLFGLLLEILEGRGVSVVLQ